MDRQTRRKQFFTSSEMTLVYIIIGLCLLIGGINNAFFSVSTIIGTTRSMLVMIMFALCELMVILSGGIDVSFPAIASFSMYTTITVMLNHGWNNPLLGFLMSGILGMLFGIINAVLVGTFRMPALIATLAVSSIANGGLLTFVGSKEIMNIPTKLDALAKTYLFSYENAEGVTSALSTLIIIPAVLCVVFIVLLRYTMLGRSIRAIGGDYSAAQRAGFNVIGTQYFIYMFVGFITGVAAMTYTVLMRNTNPVNLMGQEMMVIAAVVIGGARITGGHGSVIGTVLGVLLIQIITNNLIMIGVPNYWQKFVIGMIIILGTCITSIKAKRVELSQKI